MSFGLKKGQKKPNQEGGKIQGPGTGTSDDVQKTVPSGSYIMPKDSTDAIGEENLERLGKPTDVNLSNGEFQLTPDQVHQVGVQALEQMKGQTHTQVNQPQVGYGINKKPELFFANGGLVSSYPSADEVRKAQQARLGGPQIRDVTPEQQQLPATRSPQPQASTPNTPAPAGGGSGANGSSFLSRAGSKVAGAAKGLGVLHGIGSMIGGAVEGFNTSTEDYATRMGLDPNADRGLAANLGIRAAGVMSDVGNTATFGMLGHRFDDKNLNQAKADLAAQQQRFAEINTQRNKAPATTAPQVPPKAAAPSIEKSMNDAMYGQDQPQAAPAAAQGNDPYKIQQKGNSFSYANPGAASQARAAGIPELQSSGFAGGITPSRDPQGVKNFMANTREMGPSEQQIQAAIEKQMNRQGQGFGAIRQPQAPQRSEFDEAERKALFRDASTVIKGARGLTGGQLRLRQQLIDGDASLANQRYITDANNATSIQNNTEDNSANILQTGMRESSQNMRHEASLGQDNYQFNTDFGLKQRQQNLTEKKEGFGVRQAERAEKLYEMYDKAETDEQRQSIQARIDRLTGAKEKEASNPYMKVKRGEVLDNKGNVIQPGGEVLFNYKTGQSIDPLSQTQSQVNTDAFENYQVVEDANGNRAYMVDGKYVPIPR